MKLVDKKMTTDLMQLLDMEEAMGDQLVKARRFCWYGHVLRKNKNNIPRRALDFCEKGTREMDRTMKTRLKQPE